MECGVERSWGGTADRRLLGDDADQSMYSLHARPDCIVIKPVDVGAQLRHERRVKHLMFKRRALRHQLRALNPRVLRCLNEYLLELGAFDTDGGMPGGNSGGYGGQRRSGQRVQAGFIE